MKPFSIIAAGLLLAAGVNQSLAQPLPEALARFQFDGNEEESTGNLGNALVMDNFDYPAFRGSALYGNGVYGGFPEQTPAIRTRSLDYKSFTIALRFKATSFKDGNNNILSGGRYSSWISFCNGADPRNPSGNMTITFNDQDFTHEYPVKLETGKWYALVCCVNLRTRTVTTYLDGDLLPSIQLPRDFQLRVLQGDKGLVRKAREKSWYLSNYSTRQVFHGLVDELAVFNGDVASLVSQDYCVDPQLVKVLGDRQGLAGTGVADNGIGPAIEPSPRDLQRIEMALKQEDIQATPEGVLRYLAQRDAKRTIAQLVRQLGDDNWIVRENASARLRSLGVREALYEAASSKDPEVAFRGAQLLARPPGKPMLPPPPLLFALDYLRLKPSSTAVPALFSTLEKDEPPWILSRVCAALVPCAQAENRELVVKSLANENPRVRFAAILASDKILDAAAKSQLLVKCLEDQDELVRLAAASSLRSGRIEEAANVLEGLRESPSFTIRQLASSLGQRPEK